MFKPTFHTLFRVSNHTKIRHKVFKREMSNIDYSGFPVKNMSCGIGAAIFYREVRIFFLKNDCKIAFAVVGKSKTVKTVFFFLHSLPLVVA